MSAPGFWENSDAAAKVSADHARAAKRLEQFRSLEADVDDLDSLVEMASEDAEIAAELTGQLASIEARLEALEE
ncbi:MAG: peptide chain release factor 2, partial [Solirubrobacteraceae bacterium]|nr:peptide chain release factor 2 [Solirubrobacteraceae bacterium]